MASGKLSQWLVPGRRNSVPILTLLLLGFAAPLFTVIAFSFAPPRTFSPWQTPGLENYRTIFAETYYQSFAWSLSLALIAVAVLFQASKASPALIDAAAETASAQGWRRPLLAWLKVQALRAEKAGDAAEQQRLQRRIALVEAPR